MAFGSGSATRAVWLGVASGAAKVVVGARSALFLPWRNLGLIVVDEEHEPAFKQEDGVRYHARDMAVVLGSRAGFRWFSPRRRRRSNRWSMPDGSATAISCCGTVMVRERKCRASS